MFPRRPFVISALIGSSAVGGGMIYSDLFDTSEDRKIEERVSPYVSSQETTVTDTPDNPFTKSGSEQTTQDPEETISHTDEWTLASDTQQTFPLSPMDSIAATDLPIMAPKAKPSGQDQDPAEKSPKQDRPDAEVKPSKSGKSLKYSEWDDPQSNLPDDLLNPLSAQDTQTAPNWWERTKGWVKDIGQKTEGLAQTLVGPRQTDEEFIAQAVHRGQVCVAKNPAHGIFPVASPSAEASSAVRGDASDRYGLYRRCLFIQPGFEKFITNEFLAKVETVAAHVGAQPTHLLAIMAGETGGTFTPSKTNQIGATGLIQFTKGTAQNLGTSTSALRQMNSVQQLDYVQKYLDQRRAQGIPAKFGGPEKGPVPLNNVTRLYSTVWYGSPLSDESAVLYKHPSKPYDLNWPMDVDPDTGKLDGGRTNRAAHIGVKGFITGKDLVWFVKNHGTRSDKPGCEHFLD
ncbi:MAG: hypothetical protein M1488_01205 [Gammaproteobacteria bacterium]|nr:hypothetical protein [Gammaproteobacteria bacterium]